MSRLSLSNVLLAVIAICLVLIAMRLYQPALMSEAHAQASPKVSQVILVYWDAASNSYKPVATDLTGKLITRPDIPNALPR